MTPSRGAPARAATGRPARSCGDNCRPVAHRAKVRVAGEAAAREARLAEATATTARLRRPLEEAGFRDVAEHAALVVSCAADPARPWRDLDQVITGLNQAAAGRASLTRQYREASDLACQPGGVL